MIKINRPKCPNEIALAKNYKHPDNKSVIAEAGFNKCMYCEEKILSSQFGDIEHIKPKAKFKELEFTWDNLGLVCSKCNNAKSDNYDEENPFINPYSEDPEEHIVVFGATLHSKRGSERGEMTISQIDLNRAGLVEKRYEKINMLDKAIKACFRTKSETLKNNALEELKKEADQDKEYSLSAKFLLKSHQIL